MKKILVLLQIVLVFQLIGLWSCQEDFMTGSVENFIQSDAVGVPRQLEAKLTPANEIHVKWESVKDADSYRLYVSEQADFLTLVPGFPEIKVKDNEWFIETGILPNRTYYIRVLAENKENLKSKFSETVKIEVPNGDARMYFVLNPFPTSQMVSTVDKVNGQLEWLGFNFQFFLGIGQKLIGLTGDKDIVAVHTFQDFFVVDKSNGELKWKKTIDGLKAIPFMTAQHIVVASLDGFVYAFDKSTGNEKWRFDTKNPIHAAPTGYKDVIYIVSKQEIIALSETTGTILWQTPAAVSEDCSPTIQEGLLYFSTTDKKVNAVDIQTGIKKWVLDLKESSLGSPTAANGHLYVSTKNGQVMAIESATGKIKWTFQNTTSWYGSPLLGKTELVLLDEKKQVHIFDALSGVKKGELQLENLPSSPCTISKFGYLYIPAQGEFSADIWRIRLSDKSIIRTILDEVGQFSVTTTILVEAGDGEFAYPTESGNKN